MPGKTTNIFCSSTTTGLQGEVQLCSPGFSSKQEACQYAWANSQDTNWATEQKVNLPPSQVALLEILPLVLSCGWVQISSPDLFPLRICVSSPSRKAWCGWVSPDLLRIFTLNLPFCIFGTGSGDGPCGGDKIERLLYHLGFLVSNNRNRVQLMEEMFTYWSMGKSFWLIHDLAWTLCWLQ